MASQMELWVGLSTIATGVVTVGGAILGYLMKSQQKDLKEVKELLLSRQDKQEKRMEELWEKFHSHQLYVEQTFVKRNDLDELKLSIAEIKAILLSGRTEGGQNAGKKG